MLSARLIQHVSESQSNILRYIIRNNLNMYKNNLYTTWYLSDIETQINGKVKQVYIKPQTGKSRDHWSV